MTDGGAADKWGAPAPDEKEPGDKPLQTVRSKFLDAVKRYVEKRYLELVVEYETPTSGYAYIQKKEGFSNLYSFHFDFSSESATFYLGTEKVAASAPEQRRDVSFSGGAQLESVLEEIRRRIDEAAKEGYPELTALSNETPVPSDLSSLRSGQREAPAAPGVTLHDAAATVWGQDENGTRSDLRTTYRRGSRLPATAAAVVILAVLFLVFVPVLQYSTGTVCPSNWPLQCSGGSPVTFYASVTSHYLGVGGEYFPPGQGLTVDQFFGLKTLVSGGVVYGFGFWRYYFAA